MALHKPKQLYVLGKLRFCSIKPMKMIEIWLHVVLFVFIQYLYLVCTYIITLLNVYLCIFSVYFCNINSLWECNHSIKPMKMIEIWLKITFIFIKGHHFQSGIKSVCDECKNNGFFSLLDIFSTDRKIRIFASALQLYNS
jgi:hypothetical protein